MEPAVESGRYAAAYRLAPIGAADPLSATFLLPSGLTDHYTFETYLYHEAIPGHHLQLGLTRELDLPLIQKLGWWTSFKEGWATYAQTLAYELGLYSDPLSRIGYFAELLHTAARTALETGYLAGVWSREEARAFTEEYFGWFGYDTDYVDRSTDQLVHDPYRLTTYFVGWITFLDERQRAMNVLGEAFDLAEFHDAVLRHGTVPLDTLTTIVDRYIIETFFGFNRISEPEIAP